MGKTAFANSMKPHNIYLDTFIRNSIVFAISSGIMYWAAGRIIWLEANLFWTAYYLISLGVGLYLVWFSSDLMKERQDAVFKKDVKSWDRWILAVNMILTTAMYALIGLDAGRFGWSKISLFLRAFGGFLMLISFIISTWAAIENRFMSSQVRIQSERGHQVAKTGPYAIIRHPMYAGYCLLYIGMPLVLNSWCGIIPGLLLIFVMIIRTRLEDHTLKDELPRYADYAKQVRYRLIPSL